MSTAAARNDQDARTLYVAFELGEKEWKLAMSSGLGVRARFRTIRSRTTARILAALEQEKARVGADQVVSCYEAGAPRIDLHFPDWLAAARLWDGSPLAPGIRARFASLARSSRRISHRGIAC